MPDPRSLRPVLPNKKDSNPRFITHPKKVNRKKGNPRKGQRYRTVTRPNGDVIHVYDDGTRIGKGVGQGFGGNKKPPKKPNRPRTPGATSTGFDPLEPLTGRAFKREQRAATRLQFGDLDRQLNAERRISNQQQQNIPAWFAQYKQAIAAAQGNAAGLAQGLQQGAYQQANQAAAQGNQQVNQQQQAAQGQAQKLGVTYQPGTQQDAGQAVAARQMQQTQFGTLMGQQGMTQANFLGNRGAIAAGQGVQAQMDEVAKRALIEETGRSIAKDKGAFKLDFRNKARASERDWQMQRAAFGLDQQQEANDAASAAADDRRMNRKDRFDRADKRADNRRADIAEARQQAAERRQQQAQDWAQAHPNAAKGSNPYKGPAKGWTTNATHTQAVGYQGQVRGYVQTLKPLTKRKDKNGKKQRPADFNQIYAWLTEKGEGLDPLPPDLAEATALRIIGRFPSTKAARSLYKKYGVRMKHKDWPR